MRKDGEIWYDPPHVYRYDLKHNKTNKCGTVITKPLRYVTYKRELLNIYRSLGISKDILDFISNDLKISLVEFDFIKEKYYSTVETLLSEGKEYDFKNEPCTTYHLPLSQLHRKIDLTDSILVESILVKKPQQKQKRMFDFR